MREQKYFFLTQTKPSQTSAYCASYRLSSKGSRFSIESLITFRQHREAFFSKSLFSYHDLTVIFISNLPSVFYKIIKNLEFSFNWKSIMKNESQLKTDMVHIK